MDVLVLVVDRVRADLLGRREVGVVEQASGRVYVPEDVPAGMRTTKVALAAAPPGMSPIICGSDSTAMPLVPTRPTVTDLAVFGRSVRSTTVEPTILDSMRPEFWMTTFNGTVWPAGTSFDPAIEAESAGPPDVYFAPAAAGDATSMKIRNRAAMSCGGMYGSVLTAFIGAR